MSSLECLEIYSCRFDHKASHLRTRDFLGAGKTKETLRAHSLVRPRPNIDPNGITVLLVEMLVAFVLGDMVEKAIMLMVVLLVVLLFVVICCGG